MSDAETEAGSLENVAEVALVALGSMLEWVNPVADNPDFHQAWVGVKIYSVALVKRHKKFRPTFCDTSVQTGPGISPLFYGGKYRTVAEAKAACEHHHATGKWE